jgi:hypothetical protein
MNIQTSFLNSIRYNRFQGLGVTFSLPLEYGISLGQVVSDLLGEIADPACCDVHHSERPSILDFGLFSTLTQIKGTTITLLRAPWHSDEHIKSIKQTAMLLVLHGFESFLKTFNEVRNEEIFPLEINFSESETFTPEWISPESQPVVEKYIKRSPNSPLVKFLVH